MISNEKKILTLDEEHSDLVEEPTAQEGWKGSYAWSFISYAEPHEFLPLLAQAKHWCYIKHDKDKNEDGTPKVTHYHILARFPTERSLNSCRKLQLGTQNLLGKQMRKLQDQMKLTAYLTHDTDACRKAHKHIYSIEDVVYKANDNYWEKQFDKEADQANQKASNEDFLNDLLAEDFSLRDMAIKYGRDFIKNFDKYMKFRGLFTIKSWEPTEADIDRKEREYNRDFNECQAFLEEMADDTSMVEVDAEIRKIRLEKTKNGNQN